ncbi:DUF58 domain-containing protein [Paenibacillus oceani]|uniref:DUF58 domain-containing protein n=1 Tax=Paenibacillus oceani TaxID=2772510 RepID=A0A927H1S6_9BACL|nr:DUF58 domain-containing protein [Paenibacillus oceani]MBD2864512.1 DUF58 domain-containing protein [Paenibacillus oceani]
MSVHWLLIITALIVFAQGKAYQWWGFRHVSYKRYFDVPACFQGDEVQLVEVIANRKAMPMPWLRLESLMHAGLRFQNQSNLDISSGELFQNHKSLFSLMPYTRITRKHKVLCLKRGCYDLQTATMTSGDLLGVFVSYQTLYFDKQTRLLVYPEPIPLEDIPLPSHSWQGDISVRRWVVDDPFRIAGVREYRYGDTMNTINWSATARTGRLQVHQRDYTADHRIMIYLNFEITETMWGAVTEPERIEKGISYAAALAEMCIGRGIDTGFGCNGCVIDQPKEPVRIPPSGGDAHLTGLYETMAMLLIERTTGFAEFIEYDLLQGTSNTDFIVITSYISENMERQFERLRYNGNAVQVVMLEEGPSRQAGSGQQAGQDSSAGSGPSPGSTAAAPAAPASEPAHTKGA